jgi:adhesin transport system outer membrane protein
MKRSLLLSLALLPLLANALSIDEVVQQTVKTHPQVQMNQENYLAEKELLTRVKSGYLPSVDLSYTVGPEVTKTPANNRARASLTQQQSSVTVTQNVFTGLGDKYGIAQQKAVVSSSNDKVKESENKLALEAATAYLEVLKTYNLVRVNKENVAVHKKYLDQIEKSVNAGVGRTSDYKQTLSRYQNALNIRYLAEQNYVNAISSFKRIHPGEVNISDLGKPAVGAMPADNMAALVKIALQNNPTIKVSYDDIQAAQAGVKKSNAPFFPTADIQLKSYWNEDVHGVGYNGQEGKDTGYSALLILNYNIFNGLADSSARQASKHRLLNKDYTLADAQRFIKANTEIAWQTYNLTKKQLIYISNYVKRQFKFKVQHL